MARTTSVNVQTQLDADGNEPILLVILTLNSGTLRFASYQGNVVFDGNTFSGKGIRISAIDSSLEGQIGRITVSFDNVIGDMSAYLDKEDFYNKQVQVWRIYKGVQGATADYVELFTGFCEEVEEVTRHFLTFTATTGKPLQRKTLLNIYSRQCNHKFGDAVCNQDGLAAITGGLLVSDAAVSSGGTNFILGIKTDLGPVDSGTTDFWRYGVIQFWKKGSGVTKTRIVRSSSSGTSKLFFTVAHPTSVTNAYTYNVRKGCDKSWHTCQADNGSGSSQAWGPSANNHKNFKGFIYISKDLEGRT